MRKPDKPYSIAAILFMFALIGIMCFMTVYRPALKNSRTAATSSNGSSQTEDGTDARTDEESPETVQSASEARDAVEYFTRRVTDRKPQKYSPHMITINTWELENAFRSADGVLIKNMNMYYNPEDYEPIYVYRAGETGNKARYARYSPSMKSATDWRPQISAPGILMTSPFRYFIVYKDSIEYQDYNDYCTFDYNGNEALFPDNSNVPDILPYAQMLAEKKSFTIAEFAPIIWLVRMNYLIGYKDQISWFKIPGPDGTIRFVKYVPGTGLVDVHTITGSVASVPAAVAENKILFYYTPEVDYRIAVVDLLHPDEEHPVTEYFVYTEEDHPITTWTYLIHNDTLYITYTEDGLLYAVYLKECDLGQASSLTKHSMESHNVKNPESILVFYDQDGSRWILVSDKEHVTSLTWGD